MSDLDPDNVPTKPMPVSADAGAPTEPLSADLLPEAAVTPTMPSAPRTPGWAVPVIAVLGFALLLVLAVAVLPTLLADHADPVPSVTPTLEVPTPTLTEDAPDDRPATEEPPVVVEPQPTETAPAQTETPVEPEPTATP